MYGGAQLRSRTPKGLTEAVPSSWRVGSISAADFVASVRNGPSQGGVGLVAVTSDGPSAVRSHNKGAVSWQTMIVGGTPRSDTAIATRTVTGGVTKGAAKASAVKTVAVTGAPAVAQMIGDPAEAGLVARAVRIKAEAATEPSAMEKRTVAGVISAVAPVIMAAGRAATTAAEARSGSSAAMTTPAASTAPTRAMAVRTGTMASRRGAGLLGARGR
jgi:hypothetical protein